MFVHWFDGISDIFSGSIQISIHILAFGQTVNLLIIVQNTCFCCEEMLINILYTGKLYDALFTEDAIYFRGIINPFHWRKNGNGNSKSQNPEMRRRQQQTWLADLESSLMLFGIKKRGLIDWKFR